jgi:SNF2 family DNA or RNA helicase
MNFAEKCMVDGMSSPETIDWVVSGHYVIKPNEIMADNHVSSEEFWAARKDDFTSHIGLSIEGFGRIRLCLKPQTQVLVLQIISQNFIADFLGDDKNPRDHFVYGSSWIPLRREEAKVYSEFIQAEGLVLGQKPNFEQYLRLVKGKNQLKLDIDFDSKNSLPSSSLEIKKVNSGLAITPYEYQQTGIDWLCAIRRANCGAILGDEMGLGKTLQLIGLAENEFKKNTKPRVLIIVPSSLKLNWQSEFEKFLPERHPYLHSGPARAVRPEKLAENEIVLTTYPILNRDAEMLRRVPWTLIICDEAHAMKNPDSVTRKSVSSLQGAPLFLSTGTPLENNLMDLWSLIDLVRPGLMGSKEQMSDLLVNQFAEAENISELVRPLIMRRLVLNVLPDLPELIEKVHWIQPSHKFVSGYEAIRNASKISSRPGSQFSLISKLRRFCTYPAMAGYYFPDEADAKVDLMLDILDQVSLVGEKAIVFTSWHESADFIKEVLTSSYPGLYCEVVDGREASDERFPKIQEFQKITGFGVLVCNTRAAGEGLNIVAANHVLHYDRQWNPAKESQATARAHRMGQKRTVFVHKLVYKGTIEEVIDNRLLVKTHLAERALMLAEEEEDRKSIADALGIKPEYIEDGV